MGETEEMTEIQEMQAMEEIKENMIQSKRKGKRKSKKQNIEKIKCKGLNNKHGPCKFNVNINELYCVRHSYLKEFSEDDLKTLYGGGLNCCSECNHFHIYDTKTCTPCLQKRIDARNIDKKPKCNWYDCNKEECKFYPMENNIYCDMHQYIHKYSDKMKEYSIKCVKCRRYTYCGNESQCIHCRDEDSIEDIHTINEKISDIEIRIGKDRICKGITRKHNQCTWTANENEIYCEAHLYFKDFSAEKLQLIKDGKMKKCNKCQKFNECPDNRCDSCKLEDAYHNDKNNKKRQSKLVKCEWYDRNNKLCNNNVVNQGDYCGDHQHIIDYTDEMKKASKLCTGCKRFIFCDEFDTCKQCRLRSKNNKRCVSTLILCKSKDCDFKASDNGYCGKHQTECWKVGMEADGSMKVCIDYVRGCRNTLSKTDSHTRCEKCRKAARVSDKQRVINIIERNENILAELHDIAMDSLLVNTINIICTECRKEKDSSTFITSKGINSTKCGDCLEKLRVKDAERDRTDRDYTIYESQPHVKAMRRKWRLDNPGKNGLYSCTYREKQKRIYGISEFRRRKAEEAKIWRRYHPEEMQKIYNRYKYNIDRKIYTCKYSAKSREINYELTDLETAGFFQARCYYCGVKPIKDVNLNGIDRKDNNIGYTFDNCVTSCTMCNYMKNNLWDENEFILVAEHILTIHGFINGKLHSKLFKDYMSANYDTTEYYAYRRDIEFKLSNDEFNEIKQNACYICGKLNSKFHNNGIDRVINNICYVKYNCQACCGSCNIIKKNYDFKIFIRKLLEIYKNNNSEFVICDDEFDRTYHILWDKIKSHTINKNDIINNKKKIGGLNSHVI
jgi:hypothetical protein